MAIQPVRGLTSPGSIKSPIGDLASTLLQQGQIMQNQASAEEAREYNRARQNTLDARASTDWQQKQDAVAKKLASEKAMKEFIANPNLYQYADKNITKAADNAVIKQYESGKMKGLMDQYTDIKDDEEAQAFYMKNISPLDKQMQTTYENAPVYKENVKSGVFQDMLKKGVDVNTADAMSKRYAEGFSSAKDLQSAQDTAANNAFKNNLERAKVLKDLSKDDRTAAIKEYEYFTGLTPAQQTAYIKSKGKKDSSGGKDTTPAWAKLIDENTIFDKDRETLRDNRQDYINQGIPAKIVDKALNSVVPMYASDGKIIDEGDFAVSLKDKIDELNTKSTAKNIAGSISQGSTAGTLVAGKPDSMTKGIVELLSPVQSKNVRKVASDKLLSEIEGIFGKSADTKESTDDNTAAKTSSTGKVTETAEDVLNTDGSTVDWNSLSGREEKGLADSNKIIEDEVKKEIEEVKKEIKKVAGEAPTEQNLTKSDILRQELGALTEQKNVIDKTNLNNRRAEILKNRMSSSGLGPMSQKNKDQWNAIGSAIGAGADMFGQGAKNIYDTYQNVVGQPFVDLVKNVPGKQTTGIQRNPDYTESYEDANAKRDKIAPTLNRLLQGKNITTEEGNAAQDEVKKQIAASIKSKGYKNLTNTEKRWLDGEMKSPAGRKRLSKLGINIDPTKRK